MVHPDITLARQKCAHFCNNLGRYHEEAIKQIYRYLLKTKSQGLTLRPDKSKDLECFVDADWTGSWTQASSHIPLSTHTRTCFIITYAGCPILWKSKMQSLIALSTTEVEYIALLQHYVKLLQLLIY